MSTTPEPPVEHGFGDTSDCLCGRNFLTVRGLREHISKANRAHLGEDA